MKWEKKQLYGHFKSQTGEIDLRKPGHDQEKETKSVLTTAQNDAIRTNYVSAQQNNKCWYVKKEMKQLIVSKCNKLPQKEYRPRYDWVGQLIHRELCKRLKFGHTTKW